MKPIHLFLLFSLIPFCTCQKKGNPELGEFQEMEFLIDLTQNNQYDASLLWNNWLRTKVTYEVYIDGICTDSYDVSHEWGNTGFTLRRDGTMTLGSENGHWLYSHNYLFWSTGNWALEVVKLEKGTLNLRWEQLLSEIPFFIDDSGEHHFYIFEYVSGESAPS